MGRGADDLERAAELYWASKAGQLRIRATLEQPTPTPAADDDAA